MSKWLWYNSLEICWSSQTKNKPWGWFPSISPPSCLLHPIPGNHQEMPRQTPRQGPPRNWVPTGVFRLGVLKIPIWGQSHRRTQVLHLSTWGKGNLDAFGLKSWSWNTKWRIWWNATILCKIKTHEWRGARAAAPAGENWSELERKNAAIVLVQRSAKISWRPCKYILRPQIFLIYKKHTSDQLQLLMQPKYSLWRQSQSISFWKM